MNTLVTETSNHKALGDLPVYQSNTWESNVDPAGGSH